jgi:hypothetical protein
MLISRSFIFLKTMCTPNFILMKPFLLSLHKFFAMHVTKLKFYVAAHLLKIKLPLGVALEAELYFANL